MARLVDRVANTAANRLFRRAEVTDVQQHGPFRVLQLQGADLRKPEWTPGDKVQLRIGDGGFTLRTFTPTRWDRDAGTTQLVAFVHGDATVTAMAALGVQPSTVVLRRERAHEDELVAAVCEAMRRAPTAPIVLTGCGPSIAAIRRALKDDGHAPSARRVKTYWEPGRAGLD